MTTDIPSRVMTALRWTASLRFAGQFFSWFVTLIVIRILSPEDYGLLAMGTVITSLLTLLNTLGTGAVLVQKPNLAEETRRKVFGVVIVVNLAYFVGLQLAAPVVAAFYGEPSVEPVLRALALQFLLLIFEALPLAKLERAIEFKRMSIVDLVTLIVGSVTTLTMALLGFGVWALVIGNLVTISTKMIGLNLITRCLVRPSFDWSGMAKDFRFGIFVCLDRALGFVFMESDKFIGGRLLGAQALGYYAVASHIASLPIQKLAGLINSVAFPAFSRAHESLSEVAPYLQKAMRMMAIVAFPVFWGIASVSHELIEVVLGEKWLPAAPLIQVLALVMPVRMIGNILSPMLWGVGRPDVSATNFLIAAVVMAAAFVVGVRFGPIGLAYAWTSVYPVVFLVTLFRASKVVGARVSLLVQQIVPAVLCAGAMAVAVALCRDLLPEDMPALARLPVLVPFGAAVYVAGLAAAFRSDMLELVGLLRR